MHGTNAIIMGSSSVTNFCKTRCRP